METPCDTVGVKEVKAEHGTAIVNCCKVTNMGETYLAIKSTDNTGLSFSDNLIGPLAPGASATAAFLAKVDGINYSNTATVTAHPALPRRKALQ